MNLNRTFILPIFVALLITPRICFSQIISAKDATILKNKFAQDQKEKDRQCKAPSCLRVNLSELRDAFSNDEKKAEKTYDGKTIIVQGQIGYPSSMDILVKDTKKKKEKGLAAILGSSDPAFSNQGLKIPFPLISFRGFNHLSTGSTLEFLLAQSEKKKLKKLTSKAALTLRCRGSATKSVRRNVFDNPTLRPFFSECKILESIKKKVVEKYCGDSDLFFWGRPSKTSKIDPPLKVLGITEKKTNHYCVKLDVAELQNQFLPGHYKNFKIILQGRVTSIDSSDPFITMGKSTLSIYLGELNNIVAVNAKVIEGRKAKLKIGEKITLLCSKAERDSTPILVKKRKVYKNTVKLESCTLLSRQK